MSVDGEENPFQTPVHVAELVQAPEAEEDATGGVIPYKNPASADGLLPRDIFFSTADRFFPCCSCLNSRDSWLEG